VAQAVSKDAGIDPVTISETLITFPLDLAEKIKWSISYDPQELSDEIQIIARDILSGRDNTLKKSQSNKVTK